MNRWESQQGNGNYIKNGNSRTEKYNIWNRKFIEYGHRSKFKLAEESDSECEYIAIEFIHCKEQWGKKKQGRTKFQ